MSKLSHQLVSERLKQLPALPTVVTELLSSFANEDVDVDQIAHQIARDQGLAARVLRVANSSFYGLQSKVGSIHEAVVVLGFRAVRSMVLAVGVNGAFRVEQCPGFDAHAYLRHGVATGLAARVLAPLAGQNPELAFTAGLLHDIGELVLASNFARPYSETLAYRKEHDLPLPEAEQAVLGLTHAEVGALLAETWRFPASLREAVEDHHTPAAAPADSLANLVHVADTTAHALGLSYFSDEMVAPLDGVAWSRLGIAWEDYARALPQIEKGFDDTYQAMA